MTPEDWYAMGHRRLTVAHPLLGDVTARYNGGDDVFYLLASIPDEGLFPVHLYHGRVTFYRWRRATEDHQKEYPLPATYLPWFDHYGDPVSYPQTYRALQQVENAMRLQLAETGA